jgi:hypothetical protein
MNLGQMMMVVAALSILGILVLNTNTTVLETNDTQNLSEFGINAISLATSLVEEANGKMFDEVIADSTTPELSNPISLSSVANLGPDGGESYRTPGNDFDDFDDFDGLVLVYRSPLDSSLTAGATKEFVIPGIRAKFIVHAKVDYVAAGNLNVTSGSPTWHKKITVTVSSPAIKDTLVYPAIMSYWN